MPYILLKKRSKKRTKREARDEKISVSYDPINIVGTYEEARELIESDTSLALSYSSSEIEKAYPEVEELEAS